MLNVTVRVGPSMFRAGQALPDPFVQRLYRNSVDNARTHRPFSVSSIRLFVSAFVDALEFDLATALGRNGPIDKYVNLMYNIS
jgi:hypothetical protein